MEGGGAKAPCKEKVVEVLSCFIADSLDNNLVRERQHRNGRGKEEVFQDAVSRTANKLYSSSCFATLDGKFRMSLQKDIQQTTTFDDTVGMMRRAGVTGRAGITRRVGIMMAAEVAAEWGKGNFTTSARTTVGSFCSRGRSKILHRRNKQHDHCHLRHGPPQWLSLARYAK
jgi:hypothetical protein